MSCRSDTQVAHTAPPLLLQGRVTFTGVSHEQQRIQRHQQLREKRLQQLEEARLAKVAEAEARRKRRRTAKAQATVDHLSLTAANNMTRSVNEALATYCRFEELPMYQPAKRGVDERVTLGYTFQGMPVRFPTLRPRTPAARSHTTSARVHRNTNHLPCLTEQTASSPLVRCGSRLVRFAPKQGRALRGTTRSCTTRNKRGSTARPGHSGGRAKGTTKVPRRPPLPRQSAPHPLPPRGALHGRVPCAPGHRAVHVLAVAAAAHAEAGGGGPRAEGVHAAQRMSSACPAC